MDSDQEVPHGRASSVSLYIVAPIITSCSSNNHQVVEILQWSTVTTPASSVSSGRNSSGSNSNGGSGMRTVHLATHAAVSVAEATEGSGDRSRRSSVSSVSSTVSSQTTLRNSQKPSLDVAVSSNDRARNVKWPHARPSERLSATTTTTSVSSKTSSLLSSIAAAANVADMIGTQTNGDNSAEDGNVANSLMSDAKEMDEAIELSMHHHQTRHNQQQQRRRRRPGSEPLSSGSASSSSSSSFSSSRMGSDATRSNAEHSSSDKAGRAPRRHRRRGRDPDLLFFLANSLELNDYDADDDDAATVRRSAAGVAGGAVEKDAAKAAAEEPMFGLPFALDRVDFDPTFCFVIDDDYQDHSQNDAGSSTSLISPLSALLNPRRGDATGCGDKSTEANLDPLSASSPMVPLRRGKSSVEPSTPLVSSSSSSLSSSSPTAVKPQATPPPDGALDQLRASPSHPSAAAAALKTASRAAIFFTAFAPSKR